MFTADYRDLIEKKSNNQKHGITIKLENTEVDKDRCLQHVYSSRIRKGFWINYHWMVFRAKSTTARLIVSDWESEGNPGGSIGQELIYNFIEIQPYLEN